MKAKLPSKKEAVEETRKRLLIAYDLKKLLKDFSEEIAIVGSVAFGTDYSVNHGSDLDMLVVVKKSNCKKLLGISKGDAFVKEAVSLMGKGKIDNFTLNLDIDYVEIQLHVWEESAHKKARLLRIPTFRRLTPSKKEKLLPALDFRGHQYAIPRKSARHKEWYIKETPVFCIIGNSFVPLQTINNILSVPKILCSRNNALPKDAKVLMRLVKKLLDYENAFSEKKGSVLNCLWKNWNFSPKSKRMLMGNKADLS